ncbi:PREDICTED: piggyBac transposable element-derived protein 4-like [Polistes canadensis]|uniref:piggyBac transposable element-derived protein 4-like n=1 Tax=Polistes canadensis TaxID=91411 RepID=UPI000718DA65|nr:PREDICTED: piggyBac transposable element-derived protein 4-like [Polistes canadensis]
MSQRSLESIQSSNGLFDSDSDSDLENQINVIPRRNVVEMLRKLFNEVFQPCQRLCIDESLLLYKGRLSFKQYIPSKRSRFGIKSFISSDCDTGFVQDLIIYAGSSTTVDSENASMGKSGAIVETLMKPHLGKGHTLYVDN